MQIKDLITRLKALYNTYDDAYKEIAGEPEIMIDIFGKHNSTGSFSYKGISGHVVITKSSCGVYDILSAFDEDQNQKPKASQSASSSLPNP